MAIHLRRTTAEIVPLGKPYDSCLLTAEEIETLVAIAGRPRRNRFAVGRCYETAQKLIVKDNRGLLAYVEGVVVNRASRLATHHAWVALGGKVVDLTWRRPTPLPGPWGDRVVGTIPDDLEYFGVEFERGLVAEYVLTTNTFGGLLPLPDVCVVR